jgi:autotransporter-associated beta strand protein
VDLNGNSQTVGGLRDSATTNVSSSLTNLSAVPALFIINANTSFTFDGPISGPISLLKQGPGVQVLTAASSYTGNTTVLSGILTLATASLNDAADVFLNSGGLLNLTHTATDSINRLEMDGVGQPAGLYGPLGSGAPYETGLLTGTGKLLVLTSSVPDPFATWMDNFLTLTTIQKARNADPDGDGLSNFTEFAFGTDPTLLSASSNYFLSWEDTTGDPKPESILTLAVREGSVFTSAAQPTAQKDGVSYTVRGSYTLTDFAQPSSPSLVPLGPWIPTAAAPSLPGGYEWQRFRMTGSDSQLTRGFYKATAVGSP